MEGNQQGAVRILLAEDVAADADLAARALKRAGMRADWRVVDSEEAFRSALFEFDPQVILSDFLIAGFDGMAALSLARDLCPDTPFLFVSGSLGEDYAIRALKNGAADYVPKANLVRLPAAIERALGDAAERDAHREMQARLDALHERMHALFETLPDAIWSTALPDAKLIYMSPAAHSVLGRSPAEFAANAGLRSRIVHPGDLARVELAWAALRAGDPYEIEYRILMPDESVRWVHERAQRVCGAGGVPLRVDGITRDITDRVAQRERLARLARIRELLGATNAAIVRLRDRNELFSEFCRIAVDIGGFFGGRVVEYDSSGRLRVAVATDGWEAVGQVVGTLRQVLDTRFNGGGNLVEPLTVFLSGQVYYRAVPRGRQIGVEPGQRWTKPSIVVMNEGNYSDAHCFPTAYKALGIGDTVGMPVPGTCTSVWWERLQDRALTFGIPEVGYLDKNGKLTENQHLDPDSMVDNDPALEAAGRDQQLEKAVEVLLAKLPRRSSSP